MFQKSIQAKLSLALSVVILVATVVVSVFIAHRNTVLIEERAAREQRDRVGEVSHLLAVTHSIMSKRVDTAMRYLQESGLRIGAPNLGELVAMNGQRVPDLRLGDVSQVENFALVDDTVRMAGGTATLFVKRGDEFVRVATNVIHDGRRAIGTRLDPEGRVIRSIRNGQAFYGQVDILGNPFLTGYAPITDVRGQTIGIWYIGYEADLQGLEQTIDQKRIMNQGFVALVDDRGRVRMHSNNVAEALVTQMASKDVPGWVVERQPFAEWGYQIITAYPQAEIRQRTMNQLVMIVVGAVLLSVIILLIIHQMLKRLVTRPLEKAVEVAENIVSGRLNNTIAVQSQDETGRLMKALDEMQTALRDFMHEVNQASDQVSEAAVELASVTRETQRGVDDQSGRTLQVATAMNQMSATVSEVASNAVLAAEATQSAEREAGQVRRIVSDTVASIQALAAEVNEAAEVMRSLAEDSDKIGSILDVIRNIADQTNLLALNAAIEAARAGEQGRGFAVVADEVRTLASRTQASTEEIHSMIQRLQNGAQNAVNRVESGHVKARGSVDQVGTMSRSLDAIMDAVARINEMNMQVASAAEEQSAVAEDVNRNIMHITDISESTSENAQRTSAAASQLGGLSEELRQLVRRYRL